MSMGRTEGSSTVWSEERRGCQPEEGVGRVMEGLRGDRSLREGVEGCGTSRADRVEFRWRSSFGRRRDLRITGNVVLVGRVGN